MNQTTSHSSLSSLDEWLFYLESIHATEIDMGLARISVVAKRLNIALTTSTVITVAGTNGKGTTCAFLENALISDGHSVAVYSSPHIEKFNERLRINHQYIDDQSLINAFVRIEESRAEISLTYYEYTTLAALLITENLLPDYVILEVGLGGRLDATNLIDSDIAVITSIDIDHQAFLGNTREAIGSEKAGIFRSGRPAIIGDLQVPASVTEYCQQIQCLPIVRKQHFDIQSEGLDRCWDWQCSNFVLNDLPPTFIPRDNVATALMVLKQLNVELTTEKVSSWILTTKLQGRTEVVRQQPMVVLDVAHNPHAARYLNKYVTANAKGKVFAITAMLADKDIKGTLTEMFDCVDHWYVASLNNSRGASQEKLGKILKDANIICNSFDNVVDGYRIALENANNNDMIIIFGSFFTVAEIKKSEY
ncbi:bifunctional tetrahydrofolate synthase/dihydrofolate synthase [Thalassotalea sp. ND16A]|uniref:bifunctional tetrahydrofolate synthase/dihydrofolate synthase n=1 Tax=Thalassotalea sp. ND16A TaxID=1535422 RepID=UPI00051A62B6|nr:bifunctional tetrahydrofolate synthase/dihydrofolate synthase [Thalassotalea sp. ND16A]KGK00975.1 Dihydrofolate synthase [Thalassotalea sp. ND16A]